MTLFFIRLFLLFSFLLPGSILIAMHMTQQDHDGFDYQRYEWQEDALIRLFADTENQLNALPHDVANIIVPKILYCQYYLEYEKFKKEYHCKAQEGLCAALIHNNPLINHVEHIQEFIDAGVDVNAPFSNTNVTPLFMAAAFKQPAIVSVLLEAKADPRLLCSFKKFISLAKDNKRSQLFKEYKITDDLTPLMMAALNDDLETINIIGKNELGKTTLNTSTSHNQLTALWLSAHYNKKDAVESLLALDANKYLLARYVFSDSPLDASILAENNEIAALLNNNKPVSFERKTVFARKRIAYALVGAVICWVGVFGTGFVISLIMGGCKKNCS